MILVYDVTDRRSLKGIEKRMKTFFAQSGVSTEKDASGFYKFPVIVFGNKTDMPSREVTPKEARLFLDSIGVRLHRETSAKDVPTVDKAFYEIAQLAAAQASRTWVIPIVDDGLYNPELALSRGCCVIM